jgi:multicomponent Na+:H+ antiporter subunit C
MTPYLLCSLIFAIGVYAIIAKKNLIKIVIGLLLLEYAVNLLLVLVGYKSGGKPPIIVPQNPSTANFVDPLPQALVLTSIVIGLGITALMVALCIRLYEKYKTFDISKIKRLKG